MADFNSKEKPLHTGHRARMKDKLIRFGARFFDTYELLEMLLYSAVPYKDTNPIAKMLLERFGSLEGVFKAEKSELVKVCGVGERCAEFLHLSGQAMKAGELVYFNKANDTYTDFKRTGELFVKYFKENENSNVAVLLLDGNMRIISLEHVSDEQFGSGAVNSSGFIKAALSNNAEIAIIGYTHRHGPLFQSEADRETGKMITLELSALGVTVAEQYMVCRDGYVGVGTGVSLKIASSPNLAEFMRSKKEGDSNAEVSDAVDSGCSSSAEYMTNYLAKVLSFQLKGSAAKEAASMLCVNYGNIDRLFCADAEDVERLPGMNRNAAVLIKLLGFTASRSITDAFFLNKEHTEDEIFDYLKAHFIGLERETVYLMSFDKEGRATGCSYAGEGTVNGSDVYPRRLLEIAVKDKSARVIIAHNHPFGSAKPSREDVISTDGLASFFKSAGIELISHIVVSGREHTVIKPSAHAAK